MKKFVILFFITFLISPITLASSINPALYQTMRASSYRNNYNRQIRTQPMPYWQAQSNYMTRNRTYQNYSNYNNALYQHNSSVRYNRSFR